MQILGEVPEELRVTPERDERLLAQAQALAGTDVVRLLDLVSAALEATANGAQARIQLELVLIKATAPEVDPSTAALLARIERLEAALAAAGRRRPRSRSPAPPRRQSGPGPPPAARRPRRRPAGDPRGARRPATRRPPEPATPPAPRRAAAAARPAAPRGRRAARRPPTRRGVRAGPPSCRPSPPAGRR